MISTCGPYNLGGSATNRPIHGRGMAALATLWQEPLLLQRSKPKRSWHQTWSQFSAPNPTQQPR
jgi:hypothetical protein